MQSNGFHYDIFTDMSFYVILIILPNSLSHCPTLLAYLVLSFCLRAPFAFMSHEFYHHLFTVPQDLSSHFMFPFFFHNRRNTYNIYIYAYRNFKIKHCIVKHPLNKIQHFFYLLHSGY